MNYLFVASQSSILMLLSGELPLMSGHIKMNGSISCVPQQPWIFSGTIKQNILFGLPYDAEKYDKVVNACALIEVNEFYFDFFCLLCI